MLTSPPPFQPQVVAGQTAALALKKAKRSSVRKGMVLVDERVRPQASWEFDADIAILTHSTTIAPKYQVGAGWGHGWGAVAVGALRSVCLACCLAWTGLAPGQPALPAAPSPATAPTHLFEPSKMCPPHPHPHTRTRTHTAGRHPL